MRYTYTLEYDIGSDAIRDFVILEVDENNKVSKRSYDVVLKKKKNKNSFFKEYVNENTLELLPSFKNPFNDTYEEAFEFSMNYYQLLVTIMNKKSKEYKITLDGYNNKKIDSWYENDIKEGINL